MRFIKTPSTQPIVDYLSCQLNERLQWGERVLWLLSGGSAVEIAVKTARSLIAPDFKKLTISLADERFGPVGHPESIWQQLKDAGLDVPGAKLLPVLKGQNFEETAAAWEKDMREAFKTNNYKIALLGVGPDGHTAGILARSPASTYSGDKLVFAYQSKAIPGVRPAFKRITLTNRALSLLDEIVVPAMGQSKHDALENLKSNLPVEQQPAQIIKQVERTYVYNDTIEDMEGQS